MVARGPGARLTCCHLTKQAVPESHRMMSSLSIQVTEVLSPPWVVVLIHTLPTEPSSLSSHNQLVLFRVPDLRLGVGLRVRLLPSNHNLRFSWLLPLSVFNRWQLGMLDLGST